MNSEFLQPLPAGGFSRPAAWAAAWSGATTLLVLLLASDLGFIALHLLNALTPLFKSTALLNIETDRSYAEIFQYLKFFWVAVLLCLLRVGSARETAHCGAWALLFVYFLFDDAFKLHERWGSQLSEVLGFVPAIGLRAIDLGELIVSAAAGVVMGGALLWAYVRGSNDFRKVSQDLALLVAGLVFFGVGVDMAHEAFDYGPTVRFVFGVLEDGGEMLMASLIVWYAFLTQGRGQARPFYLVDRLRSQVKQNAG